VCVHMCVCVHTHTRIYTHIHTHTHTHIYICIHTLTHIYITHTQVDDIQSAVMDDGNDADLSCFWSLLDLAKTSNLPPVRFWGIHWGRWIGVCTSLDQLRSSTRHLKGAQVLHFQYYDDAFHYAYGYPITSSIGSLIAQYGSDSFNPEFIQWVEDTQL
jgi:hypothetical protein